MVLPQGGVHLFHPPPLRGGWINPCWAPVAVFFLDVCLPASILQHKNIFKKSRTLKIGDCKHFTTANMSVQCTLLTFKIYVAYAFKILEFKT